MKLKELLTTCLVLLMAQSILAQTSVTEIAFLNANGGDDTDPYRMRKVQSSTNNNWLELQLNDDADESFRIYGNSCNGLGCATYSSNLYHSFDVSGNGFHGNSLGIGTQSLGANVKLKVYEGGSSTGTWRGRIVSSGDASSVVLGEYNSVACIAAHNVALNAWNNLSIQHGGGNLGIGTTSPTQKVEINGGLLQNAENIGFGIDAQPNARLGFIKKGGFGPMLASDSGNPIIFAQTNQTGVHTNLSGATLTERMRIDVSGNVGIGTSSPNQKLTVNGTIYGREVKVDLSVPGPDYVFAKDYTLPSLDSVATYIEENKHLPEVPSAKEMETNGINLSEMNMLLLKKVEELTLYVIELKKAGEAQQKQIEELKANQSRK